MHFLCFSMFLMCCFVVLCKMCVLCALEIMFWRNRENGRERVSGQCRASVGPCRAASGQRRASVGPRVGPVSGQCRFVSVRRVEHPETQVESHIGKSTHRNDRFCKNPHKTQISIRKSFQMAKITKTH